MLTDNTHDDWSPNWSPDGTRLVTASDRDGPDADIFVMDCDGTNPQQLTVDRFGDEAPDWSPDGSRIAFSSFRDGDQEIYVMGPNGANLQPITINSHHESRTQVWSLGR